MYDKQLFVAEHAGSAARVLLSPDAILLAALEGCRTCHLGLGSRRITRHPMLDEFFMAKRTWGLSNLDLCEIACNGLRMKAIDAELQAEIGLLDAATGDWQNDKSQTNIPVPLISKTEPNRIARPAYSLSNLRSNFTILHRCAPGYQTGLPPEGADRRDESTREPCRTVYHFLQPRCF